MAHDEKKLLLAELNEYQNRLLVEKSISQQSAHLNKLTRYTPQGLVNWNTNFGIKPLNQEFIEVPFNLNTRNSNGFSEVAKYRPFGMATNNRFSAMPLRPHNYESHFSSLRRSMPTLRSRGLSYFSAFDHSLVPWVSMVEAHHDLNFSLDLQLAYRTMLSSAPTSIIIPIGVHEEFQVPEEIKPPGSNIERYSTTRTPSTSASLQRHTNQVTYPSNAIRSSLREASQVEILPYALYRKYYDEENLSEYQCLIRRHIEVFEANTDDVCSNAQGRHRIIVLGQVGIRCRHCSNLLPRSRMRGSTYYPSSLYGLYQAAQNMASIHFGNFCHILPDTLRLKFQKFRGRTKSNARGGRDYWAECLKTSGIKEMDDGQLRFSKEEKKEILTLECVEGNELP
jgi:hypothetical protein